MRVRGFSHPEDLRVRGFSHPEDMRANGPDDLKMRNEILPNLNLLERQKESNKARLCLLDMLALLCTFRRRPKAAHRTRRNRTLNLRWSKKKGISGAIGMSLIEGFQLAEKMGPRWWNQTREFLQKVTLNRRKKRRMGRKEAEKHRRKKLERGSKWRREKIGAAINTTLEVLKPFIVILTISYLAPSAEATLITIATCNTGASSHVNNALDEAKRLKVDIILIQEDHMTKEAYNLFQKEGYQSKGLHRTRKKIEEKYIEREAKKLSREYDYKKEQLEAIVNPNQARDNRGLQIGGWESWGDTLEQAALITDRKYRTMIMTIKLENNQRLLLVNVYGPNKTNKNNEYFEELTEVLTTMKERMENKGKRVEVIVAGDMNARLTEEDKVNGTEKQKEYEGLCRLVEELNLKDVTDPQTIWDETQTFSERQFTYSPNHLDPNSMKTRIDLVLATEGVKVKGATTVEFNPLLSDKHRMVVTTLEIPDLGRRQMTQEEKHDLLIQKAEGFRPRIKLEGREVTELQQLIGEEELDDITAIRDQLHDLKENPDRTSFETQMDSIYEKLIKGIQDICQKKIGLTTPPNYNRPNQTKDHEGIRKLKGAKRKIELLKRKQEEGTLSEALTARVIEEIEKALGKSSPKRENQSIEEWLPQVELWILKRTKKTAKRIEAEGARERSKTIRGWKGKDLPKVYKHFKRRGGAKAMEMATRYINNETQQETPATLDESIRTYSELMKEDMNWTKQVTTTPKKMLQWGVEAWQAIFNEKLEEYPRGDYPLKYMKEEVDIQYIVDTDFPEDVIRQEWNKAKVGKSPGEDMIANEVLRALSKKIKNTCIKFLRLCWEQKWTPSRWKRAIIVLLYKAGNPNCWMNYRPIALLPCIYKIFAKGILHKLQKHFHENNFIEELQFGHKKDVSITQALLTWAAILEDAKRRNKKLYIVSLDLNKAYDTVPFFLLERTMEHYRVPKEIISIIKSIYQDNTGDLHTPIGKGEQPIQFKSGIKQGCGLSPFLWVIFINPLLTKLRRSGIGFRFAGKEDIVINNVTFVDDINLIAESEEDAQRLLEICQEFMEETGLRINELKTMAIITNMSANEEVTIRVNGKKIKAVSGEEAFRILGVMFNEKMDWEQQFKKVKQKLSYDAFRLKSRCYTTKQKIALINTMLIASIRYKMNVMSLTNDQCKQLDTIITTVVRKQANLSFNHANVKLWDKVEWGGAGLGSVAQVNSSTFTANFVNYGLNNRSKFPRTCLIELAKIQGINLQNPTESNVEVDSNTLWGKVLRDLEAFKFKLTRNKSKNEMPFKFTVNKDRGEEMEDKAKNEKFIPVWSDGSFIPKTRATTGATLRGKKLKKKASFPAITEGAPAFGEVSALEHALCNPHHKVKQIIFVDYKALIDLVEVRDRKYRDEYTDPIGSYRKRIADIMDRRKQELPEELVDPEIIWIPSHHKEKLEDPEISEERKENIKKQLEYLETRFGKTQLQTILKGNEIVDEEAGKAAERRIYKPNTELYKGFPRFTITTEGGRPIEGSVSRKMKEKWQKDNKAERRKRTKAQFDNWTDFDLAKSNIHMEANEQDVSDWFGKTLRLRNMGLYLPDRTSTVTRSDSKKERKTYSLNNEIFYPTIMCELCNEEQICDLYHLHVCPKLAETNKEMMDQFDKICEEHTGNKMAPYFWCNETKEISEGKKTFTKRFYPTFCTCETPQHGEYICCHDCMKPFHPTCLGISLTKEEIHSLKDPFQCQECNPNREYFFKEGRQWKVTDKSKGKAKGKKGKKEKISTEVLITHALKITTCKNRRKRMWAEHNKEYLREQEKKHEEGGKNPVMAQYKRATLGYLPKEFTRRFSTLARQKGKNTTEINKALAEINLTVVQHNYKLYGIWLKENRKMRKAEGTDMKKTYVHNRFTKERNRSLEHWTKEHG
jgi:exonuclease III